VVVIGAGDLGSRHAQHWHAAGARVVAVCDPWLERAREVAALVGAEAATHPGAHLSRDDVHVVSVCTPTFLHESYTVAAIEAGKHVLCEKPAALTVSAAERMKAAAELHDRELRLGLMRRFDPAHHEILRRHALLGGPTLAQATIVAASPTAARLIALRKLKSLSTTSRWSSTLSTPGAPSKALATTSYFVGSASCTRKLSGIASCGMESSTGELRNCSRKRS